VRVWGFFGGGMGLFFLWMVWRCKVLVKRVEDLGVVV